MDWKKQVKRKITKAHEDKVLTTRYTHSGEKLFTGGADTKIHMWDPTNEEYRQTFTYHPDAVNDIDIDSNDSHMYSCDKQGNVYCQDIATGAVLYKKPSYHGGAVNALKYWQQGNGFVSGGTDCIVRAWDQRSRNTKKIELESNVLSLSTTHSGNILAGCFDGMIHEIEIGGFTILRSHIFETPVTSMFVGKDDDFILASCMDSELKLLDLHKEDKIKTYSGHKCKSSKVDCYFDHHKDADRASIIAGSEDGLIYFWSPLSDRPETVFAHSSAITSMSIHPRYKQNRSMVTASAKGTVSFWKPCK